jgi:hypothetical protein
MNSWRAQVNNSLDPLALLTDQWNAIEAVYPYVAAAISFLA